MLRSTNRYSPVLLCKGFLFLLGSLLITVSSCLNNQKSLTNDEKQELLSKGEELSNCLPFRSGDHWSFIDKEGENVLDVQGDFDIVYPFKLGLALVKRDSGYGFIDETGALVIPCIYSNKQSVFSFLDNPRFVIIKEAQSKQAYSSRVSEKKQPALPWTGFDLFNKTITNSSQYYEWTEESTWFENYGKGARRIRECKRELYGKFVKLEKENKFGLLDRKMQEVLKFKYEEIHFLADSTFLVLKDGKYSLLNKDEEVIKAYDFESVHPHTCGYLISQNDKLGYMTLDGTMSIPLEMDTIFNSPSSGHITFKKEGKLGWASRKGEMILPAKYDRCIINNKGKIQFVFNQGVLFKFTESENGQELQTMEFDAVESFTRDLWLTSKMGLYGIYKDTEIWPVEFESIKKHTLAPQRRTLLFRKKGNQYDVFTEKLELEFSIQADSILPINSTKLIAGPPGYATPYHQRTSSYIVIGNAPICTFKRNGKWSLLDKEGKELSDIVYDQIYPFFHKKLFSVCKNNKWGIIDNYGEIIVPIEEPYPPSLSGQETREGQYLKVALDEGFYCLFYAKDFIKPLNANGQTGPQGNTAPQGNAGTSTNIWGEASKKKNHKKLKKASDEVKFRHDKYKLRRVMELPKDISCSCDSNYYLDKNGLKKVEKTSGSSMPDSLFRHRLESPMAINATDANLFIDYHITRANPSSSSNDFFREKQEKYLSDRFIDYTIIDNRNIFVQINGKWGIFDYFKRKFIVEPIYESILYDPSEKFPRYCKLNGQWWLMNTCLEQVAKFDGSAFLRKSPSKNLKKTALQITTSNENYFVILDSLGKAIPKTLSERITPWGSDFILEQNGSWFFYDINKNTLKRLDRFQDYAETKYGKNNMIKEDGDWYLTTVDYEKITSTPYDSIYSYQGAMMAEKDGKMGILLKDGTEIIPVFYENLHQRSRFLFSDTKTMYVGEDLTIYTYDYIEEVKPGLLLVKDGNKYGYQKTDGTKLFENK